MGLSKEEVLEGMKSLQKKDRTRLIRELRAWEEANKGQKRNVRLGRIAEVSLAMRDAIYSIPKLPLGFPGGIECIRQGNQANVRSKRHRRFYIKWKEKEFTLDPAEYSISISISKSMGSYAEFRARIPVKKNEPEVLARKIFAKLEKIYNQTITSEVVEG
jgi:hypothetical protein